MNTLQIIGFILVFFILTASCVFIRFKFDKFKIEPNDIVIGLIPVILWLLLSGNITKFEYAGVTIETAFKEAQKTSIKKDVMPIPVEGVSTMLKAGINQIDYIVSLQTDAVVFLIGYENYTGDAIKEYLEKLRNSNVKYFIFVTENNEGNSIFTGLISFNDFYNAFRGSEPVASENEIAIWLKKGDKDKILNIPRMISLKYAVNEDDSRENALKKIIDSKANLLPVIDKSGKFLGIVTEGKLSASILLSISEQLNSENK